MISEIQMAIAPSTPVYFGDGRPTSAGESDFGGGRFPPSPRTLQGLVRTALLRSVGGLELGAGVDPGEVAALVGPPERLPSGWRILGPWVAEWREERPGVASGVAPWLPCPGWLARPRRGQMAFLEPHPVSDDIRSDCDGRIRHLLVGEGGFPRAWLAPDDALRVLRGELPVDPSPELPPVVAAEPHTGLMLTPGKRSAQESMLYTLGYFRFRDCAGFALQLRAELDPRLDSAALTRGSASLGGKNRIARLLRGDGWTPEFEEILKGGHLPAEPEEGARFLVWATTPVHLAHPLAPAFFRQHPGGARFGLLSAALGPTQAIGGFSLARGRGGVSRSYLPPGSAWMVEVRGGTAGERGSLLRDLHNSVQLGDDRDEATFGFGHALVALPPQDWSNL
jgi:hypothetical protein